MRVFGGRGGIRTHGTLRYTAFRVQLVIATSILFHSIFIQLLCAITRFRVRPVMTTSIPLHMLLLRTGDTAFKRKLPVRRDLFYQKAHLIAI